MITRHQQALLAQRDDDHGVSRARRMSYLPHWAHRSSAAAAARGAERTLSVRVGQVVQEVLFGGGPGDGVSFTRHSLIRNASFLTAKTRRTDRIGCEPKTMCGFVDALLQHLRGVVATLFGLVLAAMAGELHSRTVVVVRVVQLGA
jgi:hypothetical protein